MPESPRVRSLIEVPAFLPLQSCQTDLYSQIKTSENCRYSQLRNRGTLNNVSLLYFAVLLPFFVLKCLTDYQYQSLYTDCHIYTSQWQIKRAKKCTHRSDAAKFTVNTICPSPAYFIHQHAVNGLFRTKPALVAHLDARPTDDQKVADSIPPGRHYFFVEI